MAARRNLPAAVLREGDPGAEGAARVIPAAAAVVRVGSAVVGYTVSARKARQNLTPAQLQATTRIRAVAQLLRWRADAGEAPTMGAVEAALDVLADAARFIPSGRWSLANVREHFPVEWRAAASDSQVLHAIEMPRDPRAGIMGNREAGRTLNLYLVEVLALEDDSDGKPFPLTPIDETEQARASRRATRRRQMEAARKRRDRQAKRSAEYCSSRVRISYHHSGDADAACNIPASSQAEAVRAAVRGGAAKVADIVRATGIAATTVRPIISRLTKAGAVTRTGWGRYAAVPLAQADEAGRDAPPSPSIPVRRPRPLRRSGPRKFSTTPPRLPLCRTPGARFRRARPQGSAPHPVDRRWNRCARRSRRIPCPAAVRTSRPHRPRGRCPLTPVLGSARPLPPMLR